MEYSKVHSMYVQAGLGTSQGNYSSDLNLAQRHFQIGQEHHKYPWIWYKFHQAIFHLNQTLEFEREFTVTGINI